MRLSDVLSRPPTVELKQVDGFLGGKKLKAGQQRKLQVGQIALNYHCKSEECSDSRTFYSNKELYCIGVNEHLISIDCVLRCPCGSSIQMWFLVDCDGDISGPAPEIRILQRNEKLSETVSLNKGQYGELTELLEKSQHAHRERLGAGAMIYLRKIFEQVTAQTAAASGISIKGKKGGKKPFKALLEEVDKKASIIPSEFSKNGYRLFGELSDVVHGGYDEDLALAKYDSIYRLIIGILDNVKNNHELMEAIDTLEWDVDKGVRK
ncbi:MAG: hypothetical protein ACK5LX_16545 [Oscillospiraceae bacterium]